jgi:Uma2 family endonuclease
MQALAERYISEEEYWILEAESNIKHEYFDGGIYAMSGGNNRHALLCTNVSALLGSQLCGKNCRAVNSEQRVKIEATGLQTYPDASVYCAPARFEGKHNEVLLNPRVIIEVLSPSTEAYDRGNKFTHYKQIASMTDYLLIAQNRLQVDHFHRLENGDWLLHTATAPEETLTLHSIACTLMLGDLYDGLELSSELPLLREDTPEAV